MENLIKMDDLGVPLFSEASIHQLWDVSFTNFWGKTKPVFQPLKQNTNIFAVTISPWRFCLFLYKGMTLPTYLGIMQSRSLRTK